MRLKLKSVSRGRTIEKTYRANEKVTQALIEKEKKQFLYKEGDRYVFMDTTDYSQIQVQGDQLADKRNYLVEGEEVELMMYDGTILDVGLPVQVKIKVAKADPGIKGDTVSGATKKVELETGMIIEVPLFIEQGESIMVDTRTGEYISRTE